MSDLILFVEEMKKKGLSDNELTKINEELALIHSYGLQHSDTSLSDSKKLLSFYDYSDSDFIASLTADTTHTSRLYSLDKLLEKDKLREKMVSHEKLN